MRAGWEEVRGWRWDEARDIRSACEGALRARLLIVVGLKNEAWSSRRTATK